MRLTIILLLLTLFSSCQKQETKGKKNPEQELSQQLGNATLWFQQSAEMQASYYQAYDKAKWLLKTKLDTLSNPDYPTAVVLDLDETVLDNSPYEARLFLEGKTYGSESWKGWCEEANAKVLPGAEDFLAFADSLGVKIFYISNRKTDVFEPTLKNLKVLKLPQAEKDHLLLRTTKSDKTERRAKVKADHNILLYIGDNLTDYSQIFADREESMGKELVEKNRKELLQNFIILSNPMYGEWESAIYGNDFSISGEQKLEMRKSALETAK